VEQSTFARTGLANDGQHLALRNLERKVFKEHQF
jgi:hypothetical protein